MWDLLHATILARRILECLLVFLEMLRTPGLYTRVCRIGCYIRPPPFQVTVGKTKLKYRKIQEKWLQGDYKFYSLFIILVIYDFLLIRKNQVSS